MNSFSFDTILTIARRAGDAICEVYHSDEFGIETKADDTPLTRADRASHELIKSALDQLDPRLPVLSEEGKQLPAETRQAWNRFWLVDPLDGTKEFIKRNGEFTVNIAIVDGRQPVMGVIYVPVTRTVYMGAQGRGAWKQMEDGPREAIHIQPPSDGRLVAARSRSHASKEEQEVFARCGVTEELHVGSSLKFCMVAEGKAHLYYRHGPTMEWDTGAGQAIVEAAGGTVTTPKGEPFLYNKDVLINGPFVVKSSERLNV